MRRLAAGSCEIGGGEKVQALRDEAMRVLIGRIKQRAGEASEQDRRCAALSAAPHGKAPKAAADREAAHRQRLDTGVLDKPDQRELQWLQRADRLTWRTRHQVCQRVCHGGAKQRPLRRPRHAWKAFR